MFRGSNAHQLFSLDAWKQDQRDKAREQRKAKEFGMAINATLNLWLDVADQGHIAKILVREFADAPHVLHQALWELQQWIQGAKKQRYVVKKVNQNAYTLRKVAA